MKQPIFQGGLDVRDFFDKCLDVRDLQLFNEALLYKWLLRCMNEMGNL